MDRLARLFPKIDPWLYAAFCIACVSFAAHTFYSYMLAQTGGEWSAPLDDVFIHFDYARATARGYPFEWSEGNGFSSGNTSITYPFVLALGYWIGFRGLLLMKWAAIVACASLLTFLLAGARLFEGAFAAFAPRAPEPAAPAAPAETPQSEPATPAETPQSEPAAPAETPQSEPAAPAETPPQEAAPPHPLPASGGLWAKYLLPPIALSVGALDWSLFSGMENAFHLAAWALCLLAALAVVRAAEADGPLTGKALLAGLAGAFLFLTRPESAVCVAAFSLWAALSIRARRKAAFPWRLFLAMSAPGAAAFAAQSLANRLLTGEWAAAGAIAKLAINHPYMTAGDKFTEYAKLWKYVVLRNTHHHFADFDAQHPVPWGWLVPLAALLPFLNPRLRGVAALLWAQIIAWLALIALNGQAYWQNERYTMPAVAWLLVLAALGLATLISGAWRRGGKVAPPERQKLLLAALRIAAAAAVAGLFWSAQLPRMRDQIWFFGRASRNIRDQHIVAGRLLRKLDVNRVLVGDAGALLYASDLPGMDLIGLGGYHDLPFARAGVHGLGASLELIERIPPEERPDTMAIYPSWWGDLPLIFGKRLTSVPVYGNVICGGSEKVIYHADWSPLDRSGAPRSLRDGERVADEVDIADLVSEKQHAYVFPHPAGGFVDLRVLPDPDGGDNDLFDAGRVIAPGQRETMRVTLPAGGARLILRTAPDFKAKIDVQLDARAVGQIVLAGAPRRHPRGMQGTPWVEASLDLPVTGAAAADLALVVSDGAYADFHVWIVATAAPSARQ